LSSSIVPALKDRAILAGWIAGLALAVALLWSLTLPMRLGVLMDAANGALASAGDPRRLSGHSPRQFQRGELLGGWYYLAGSDSRFFVFAIMRDGILVPHGAEVCAEGRVVEMVPLGGHARQSADRIPQGFFDAHARRIEAAFAASFGAGSR